MAKPVVLSFSGGKDSVLDRRSNWWLSMIARLKPGQTREAATAALRAIQPQVREATTLVCHANYGVMRELLDFLVAECCTDSAENGNAKTAA